MGASLAVLSVLSLLRESFLTNVHDNDAHLPASSTGCEITRDPHRLQRAPHSTEPSDCALGPSFHPIGCLSQLHTTSPSSSSNVTRTWGNACTLSPDEHIAFPPTKSFLCEKAVKRLEKNLRMESQKKK